METFIQEPLFEIAEPERESWFDYAIRTSDGWFRKVSDTEAQCSYCGDVGRWIINDHQRVFNGWCAARLFCNHGANEIQLAYLERHGWEVVDAHDERNWN